MSISIENWNNFIININIKINMFNITQDQLRNILFQFIKPCTDNIKNIKYSSTISFI